MLSEWKDPEISVNERIIGLLGENGVATVAHVAKLTATDAIKDVLYGLESSGYAYIYCQKKDLGDNDTITLSKQGREMYRELTELNAVEIVDYLGIRHALDVLNIGMRVTAAAKDLEWYSTSEAHAMMDILVSVMIENPKTDKGIPKFKETPRPDGLVYSDNGMIWIQVLPPLVGATGVAKLAAQYAAVLERVSGFHKVVWIAQNAIQAKRANVGVGQTRISDTYRLRLDYVNVLGYEAQHIIALARPEPVVTIKEVLRPELDDQIEFL